MDSQPTPVFVLGSGRSGTTITAALLNRLPRIQIAKETGYLGLSLPLLHDIDNPRSLAQLVGVVNSWLVIEQWGGRASVDGFRAFCRTYDLRGASAFIHYVWQLDSPVPWHELEFIGDNTPLYVMAIPAIQELLPNARFIHVVRDPRDVVCSVSKMRFGADDMVTASMEWHLSLGCWLMAERIVHPGRRTECRYEDLCTSPEQTFGKLAGFLGRSQDEAHAALLSHSAAGAGADETFSRVAGLSHHARLAEPLSPSRVARYKSELTPEQIRTIEEIAQYGMLAYGYQPSMWHTHPLMAENRMYVLKAMIRDMAKRAWKRLRG